MRVLVLGHRYELENFEEGGDQLIIQFIQKEPSEADNTKLLTVSNGTTNEDVLRVLIDRMQFLNSKFPCRENSIVITKLEEALMWLEKRTSDRIKRGVEGKHIK